MGAQKFDFGGGVGTPVEGFALGLLGELGAESDEVPFPHGQRGLRDGETFAEFGVGGRRGGRLRGIVEGDRGD